MAAPGASVLVIEAHYYEEISEALARGALAVLEAADVGFERVAVTGALEIPLALALAVRAGTVGPDGRHQGCVALGCVIRGETSHYDIVAGESARGLMDVALRHGLALGNGILTVDSRAQALIRATPEQGDKGGMAARACLALMDVGRQFGHKP